MGALPRMNETDEVAAAREFDYVTYLRDGLLVKLDRAAMLVSLETRSPFLDPLVRSFAARLPPHREDRHAKRAAWRDARVSGAGST